MFETGFPVKLGMTKGVGMTGDCFGNWLYGKWKIVWKLEIGNWLGKWKMEIGIASFRSQ
jgi:hypothetical protein